MSLLNPVLAAPHQQRQAASLKATLAWYARNGWLLLEAAGRRRASAELQRVATRMKGQGNPVAEELFKTSAELSKR